MTNPERTTAAAFSNYSSGTVLADSAGVLWEGLHVRLYRFPQVVDRFLVPATPEPLISCGLSGTAEFRERDPGEGWVTRQIGPGDLFVTGSPTPYEVEFHSPAGQELEIVQIHVGVNAFHAALRRIYPDQETNLEVVDFFGEDKSLEYLCCACSSMLKAGTLGKTARVHDLTRLFASYIAERYTRVIKTIPTASGGLPIYHLRKVEDYVREHFSEEIPVQALADLVQLSPFHFSRVFKLTTGMTPLQFVTRERILRAQQSIRESSKSIIQIGLEVGFSNPGYFAKVFGKMVGMTPKEFRKSL